MVMNKYYFNRKPKAAQTAKKEVKKTTSKNKPNLVKKLDRLFSLYIRLRDAMPNGYVRCISCGKIKTFDDVDCGHFYSRTHMATRFDEDNCNAECKFCNRFSADHLIAYQTNLIRKIGISRFEKLGLKAKSTCHWLDSELEDRIKYYSQKVNELSREKAIRVKVK
nr:MAG TPA: NinG recombination protein [Bacteriophage sp.]